MRDQKPDTAALVRILKKIANQDQVNAKVLKKNLLLLSDFAILLQLFECSNESRKIDGKKELGADELLLILQPMIIAALMQLDTNSYNKIHCIANDFLEGKGKITDSYHDLANQEKQCSVVPILGLIALQPKKKPNDETSHHSKITLILIQIMKILSDFFNTLKKVVSEMHCGFFKSRDTHFFDAGSKSLKNPLATP